MTRARDLSKLANPGVFTVDSDYNVGVDSTSPDAKFDVVGVISATEFYGDGSKLTGIVAGATLSSADATQRVVLTSQTTGSMTEAATNSDLTYHSPSNTLSASNFSGTLLGNATGLQGTPNITVQDVTAETVSVAGTISYEDVSNVNSVGIITANKGIKVPDYGVTVTGVVTATSFQGDGSALTNIENGISQFTASGSILKGATVVVNDDGTVSGVSTSGLGVSFTDSSQLHGESVQNVVCVYDEGQDKMVVFYHDRGSTSQTTARVATWSENSNHYLFSGNPTQVVGNYVTYHDACYDANSGKIVYVYRDDGDGNNGKCRIGTVSGNNISFGTEQTFYTGGCAWPSVVYNPNLSKCLVAYSQGSHQYKGTCFTLTVSGTSPQFSSDHDFDTGTIRHKDLVYDQNSDRIIIFYRDGSTNPANQGNAKVITQSANGLLSFGSAYNFATGLIDNEIFADYDPVNQKSVVIYSDSNNNGYGTAVVATISGGSNDVLSFGNEVVFVSAGINNGNSNIIYDPSAEKFVVFYHFSTSRAVEGKIDGTVINFDNYNVITDEKLEYPGVAYDPDERKLLLAYEDGDSPSQGRALTYTTSKVVTNVNAQNYLGIAAEAISDGQSGNITILGGINTSQTGLTTARTVYIQADGSLGLSPGNPFTMDSVIAGTSISDTDVLVWKS